MQIILLGSNILLFSVALQVCGNTNHRHSVWSLLGRFKNAVKRFHFLSYKIMIVSMCHRRFALNSYSLFYYPAFYFYFIVFSDYRLNEFFRSLFVFLHFDPPLHGKYVYNRPYIQLYSTFIHQTSSYKTITQSLIRPSIHSSIYSFIRSLISKKPRKKCTITKCVG